MASGRDWASSYLEIPWLEDGRTREGADCWGLAGIIFWERRQIKLPELPGASSHKGATMWEETHSGRWKPVAWKAEPLCEYDIPVYTLLGRLHVGVMLDHQWMISTRNSAQGVIVERFVTDRPGYRRVNLEVFRYDA